MLNKKKIKKYKKKKCPKYDENQKEVVRKQCGWLFRKYRNHDFVIDDEKYFTLSHSMNDSYFSSPTKSLTPEAVRVKPKSKYEPKVMLWLAISNRGMSRPYFRKSGLAVNQHIYLNKCIKERLMPFIRGNHSNNNFVFWPDKASSHYARLVVNFFDENNIPFVARDRNPTNIPQCRPIEDFSVI